MLPGVNNFEPLFALLPDPGLDNSRSSFSFV